MRGNLYSSSCKDMDIRSKTSWKDKISSTTTKHEYIVIIVSYCQY